LTASARFGQIEDVQFGAGEAPLLVVKSGKKLPYEIPSPRRFLEKLDLERRQAPDEVAGRLAGSECAAGERKKEVVSRWSLVVRNLSLPSLTND